MSSRLKEAQEELRKMKEMRELGLRREDVDDSDSDDGYEEMSEEEYKQYKKKQKELGDFVVDDDGTGYLERDDDDGEEEEELLQFKEKGKKKAQSKAAKADDGKNQNLSSLFGRIATGGKAGASGSGGSSSKGPSASVREKEAEKSLQDSSLENMLHDLVANSGSKKAKEKKRKSTASAEKAQKKKSKKNRSSALFSDQIAQDAYQGNADSDTGGGEFFDDHNGLDDSNQVAKSEPEDAPKKEQDSLQAEAVKPECATETLQPADCQVLPAASIKSALLAAAKSRPVRAAPRAPSTPPSGTSGVTFMTTPILGGAAAELLEGGGDISGWSSHAGVTPATPPADQRAASAAADSSGTRQAPSQLALDDNGQSEFVDIFLLDMYEDYFKMKGQVFLFGKVWAEDRGEFMSCCVQVNNVPRVMHILPREAQRGSPEGFKQVLEEVKSSIIRDHVAAGPDGEKAFKVRPVELKYAFELADVPREATTYLELHYPMCNETRQLDGDFAGRSIQRIFGSQQSAIEQLVLSRELKGPMWLRVSKPQWLSAGTSWCRFNCQVENARQVSTLVSQLLAEERQKQAQDPGYVPQALNVPPPPKLRVLSLTLKTLVNARHENEVVMASGLLRDNVDLVGVTPEATNPRAVSAFTIVRPASGSGETAWPPGFPDMIKRASPHVILSPNERALLTRLLAKLVQLDPDVVMGHNTRNFDMDVLLARMAKHSVGKEWSKLGRLTLTQMPRRKSDGSLPPSLNITPGRLLVDTFATAKELLLGQRSYGLTELCRTQLGKQRTEVEPQQVPLYMQTSKEHVHKLIGINEGDAWLTLLLSFRLEALPLTHQLSSLAGGLWSRTLAGGRSERIEYLLLHEFRQRGYVLPDKSWGASHDPGAKKGAPKATKSRSAARKPKYDGGLVLEPKKGLYDKYVVLLDFNSLYPSIIQEYNICYTTVDRELHSGSTQHDLEDPHEADEEGEGGGVELDEGEALPKLPDLSVHTEQGVLPSLIKMLVDRRRAVKKELKNEKDPTKSCQLEVRQKALKLTANSMYGCLGFKHFRFFAKPVAALVTSQGRLILQSTVEVTQSKLQYEVVYGDTDSLFINTNTQDLSEAKKVADRIKQEVNKMYKLLEIDLDGIFKSLLLLQKKKYAALVVNEVRQPDGSIVVETEKETKGIELVRRDWCGLSKRVGHSVLDFVLSGRQYDEIVESIHGYLDSVAAEIKEKRVPLDELVITKGLSKAPGDYPDAKSQPHLQVALGMEKRGEKFSVGDTIPYVICTITRKEYEDLQLQNSTATAQLKPEPESETGGQVGESQGAPAMPVPTSAKPKSNSSYAERAFHPQEVKNSKGLLELDWDFYLKVQVIPPTQRLILPIEGTSPAQVAIHLGLDPASVMSMQGGGDREEEQQVLNISALSDAERFKPCERVTVQCQGCSAAFPLPAGGFFLPEDASAAAPTRELQRDLAQAEGLLQCPNCDACLDPMYVVNCVKLAARKSVSRYYQSWAVADDPSIDIRTRQQSVLGRSFNINGRRVQLQQEYPPGELYSQLKYCESLLDLPRALDELARKNKRFKTNVQPPKAVSSSLREALETGKAHLHENIVGENAYNWVSPDLFKVAFRL